jgi:hypothetical protein
VTRVLVAYATKSGCSSECAVDIAKEIATVPDLEVDVQPVSAVHSIEGYAAVYVGWVNPSTAGQRELERFLNNNAAFLPTRPVWIVHRHPGCGQDGRGAMKLTRLVATPRHREPPVPATVPAARPAPATVGG